MQGRSSGLCSFLELAVFLFMMFSALALPGAVSARSRTPVLTVPFDADLHALPGAANPFSSSNRVEVVAVSGAKGRAAHFVGAFAVQGRTTSAFTERQALIFSGANLPSRAGWIEFRLRTEEGERRNQQRRRWIVALPPVVGELYFGSEEVGLGLGLLRDERGDLVLALHRFEEGRLTADYRSKGMTTGMTAPDAIAIRFSAKEVDASRVWQDIRIGWDQVAGKVFLGVGDELRSAAVDFPATRFRALLLGTPPRILNVRDDVGFSGYLDELVVSRPTASPAEAVTMRRPAPEHAASDPNMPWVKSVENGARRHLDVVLETRRLGGWAPLVALPSRLHFLSPPTVLPYGDRFYIGMGRASSIVTATILLRGYEVLGDRRYLEAARGVGERLVDLQGKIGAWPGQALINPSAAPLLQNSQYAIIKDRIQSMPILLLWGLHAVTGDERFAEAASRGVAFLRKAQNPSGSWPNRVVVASGRHESMSGLEDAGEINDYATSDAMNVMLVMYRRTSELEYLARYLRGADWLARVFQDGRAKGWAKQYDVNGCPITARHHEPIGVAFREMDDVPNTLLQAYQLTGSSRYREVLNRWSAYVRSVESERGWYPDYDIDTGEPIKQVGGRMVAAEAGERRDYGVSRVLRRIDRVWESERNNRALRPEPEMESKRLRRKALQTLDAMDSRFGTWISTVGPQGPVMNPNSPRVLLMLHALADASAGSSSRKWHAAWRDEDWRDEFGRVMPFDIRYKRLDAKDLSAARAMIGESSGLSNARRVPCSR
jgi:hypothetical protein